MNYFNFLIYKTKQKYLTFLKCLFLLVKFFYIHFILRMSRTMVNIRLISFPDQVFQKSTFPVHKKKNEYYHNIPRVFPVSKRTNKLPHRIQHI